MRIRQSICYPMLKPPEMPLAELCHLAARIGYAAIELWGWSGGPKDRGDDLDEVMGVAGEHGLAVASMIGHDALEDGLNRPENHERIDAELHAAIDLAARHRVAGLICFSGNRNHGQSDYEGLVACAQGLLRIAPYAEERGVNLNVELLNSRVDHPGYQADRTDWGIALAEMVGSPRVKLLYDVYHMQIMEGDVIRSLRRAMPYIGHIHTAGNPGRHEPDDTQELNYRAICSAVAATGYDLYVGHEFRPRGDLELALADAFARCDVG